MFGFPQIFLLLLLHSRVCSAWTKTHNTTTVEVRKTSGTIKLSNENNTIEFVFDKIIELAQNGETQVGLSGELKHRFLTFPYQHFNEDILEEIEVVGATDITAQRKNFTADLDGPAAKFHISLIIYDDYAITRNEGSGESYEILNGTVQLGIGIGDWPFCDSQVFKCFSNNEQEFGKYLDLYVEIKGGRTQPEPHDRDRGRGDKGRKPPTYNYGGGDITFSQMYFKNNTWHEMEAGYPRLLHENDKNYLIIRFPTFESPVYYTTNVVLHPEQFQNLVSHALVFCSSVSVIFSALVLYMISSNFDFI